MLRIAAFIGLAVSVACSLVAQTQAAGTLTGKLTDPSGAVVALSLIHI